MIIIKETICREGWPLLTVETEVNGDSKRKNERGPVLVGSLSLLCLGCSSRLSKKYFFIVPIAQQAGHWAGSRSGSPVSLFVSLIITGSKERPCWGSSAQ
jgi:hypothetical protein